MIAAANDNRAIIVWSLVLLAVVIVGFVLVLWVKRRLQHQDMAPTLGFSLADLRELHRTGKISDEEFERARGKMAASLKQRESTEKPKKPP
jgi:uncharacterized membrane protein